MARGMAVFVFLSIFLLTARAAHTQTKIAPPAPAYAAEMVELDRAGSPLPVSLKSFSLSMNKRGERAVSFTFTETFGTKCPPGAMCILGFQQTIRDFRIIRQSLDGCGSTRYVAEWREKKMRARLELADHTNRMCKDMRRYTWEMTLREMNAKSRFFGGNPKSQSKEDCAEIGRDTMCIMLFAPATCTVSSINGKPLREPVSAEGGNSCMATGALKQALCERGYDWKDVEDEDVTCAMNICPVFDCAAPPEGCHYAPDPARNENGCPVKCGILTCGSGGPDMGIPEQ